MSYHLPVLADACLEGLNIQTDGVYIDATFGGGGHSALILNELGDNGRLYSFDQDEDAIQNKLDDERFTLVETNFRHMKRFLRLYGVQEADGILADLGVSSHQLDQGERGFSYRFDGPLDMRMNQQAGKSAADIVNSFDVKSLQELFSRYGEVRNSKTLATTIVRSRGPQGIQTTAQFVQLIESCIRGQRPKYLAQVFQALRMVVNEEVKSLEEMLQQSLELLKPGGRLVVMSYHSIEDRIVKNFLKSGNIEGKQEKDFYGNIYRPFKVLTKKAVTPSEKELKENPRSRSAKLRIAERITDKKD